MAAGRLGRVENPPRPLLPGLDRPLRLAISPCPNDTVLFEGLVNGRLGDANLALDLTLADIAELNTLAALPPNHPKAPDVVKVSFFAYSGLRPQFTLLEVGSALGRGVGPLLVTRPGFALADLPTARIGIPGWRTTAHLLLEFFAPGTGQRQALRFERIMPAVAAGELDVGLVIHESRFTYHHHGLHCLQDLGAYWEAQTGLPIPLGGIVARTSLGPAAHQALNRSLAASLALAQTNPGLGRPFVRQHAQEMDEDVIQQHIDLYVNPYTQALGEEGHAAVDRLLAVARGLEI